MVRMPQRKDLIGLLGGPSDLMTTYSWIYSLLVVPLADLDRRPSYVLQVDKVQNSIGSSFLLARDEADMFLLSDRMRGYSQATSKTVLVISGEFARRDAATACRVCLQSGILLQRCKESTNNPHETRPMES